MASSRALSSLRAPNASSLAHACHPKAAAVLPGFLEGSTAWLISLLSATWTTFRLSLCQELPPTGGCWFTSLPSKRETPSCCVQVFLFPCDFFFKP